MSSLVGGLTEDSLHVWRQVLDEAESDAAWLDEGEKRRAQAFRREVDRNRFINGRRFLRRVLGLYLTLHPAKVPLSKDPSGKPFVAEPQAPHFNLSHSDSVAYLVLTGLGPVGVDVEVDREITDVHSVAKSVLSADEMAALAASGSRASSAFLRVWTRKEAVVKAFGTGIASDLRAIPVGIDPQEVLVSGPLGAMRVRSLECVPGEHVAVAVARPPAVVRYYFFSAT